MSSVATSADDQIDYVPLDSAGLLDRPRRKGRRSEVYLAIWGLPIILFILIAIVGPILVPYNSVTVRTGDRLKAPGSILRDGSRAWLGTDQVGRDMAAQLLQGARISLLVGAVTVVLAGLIGVSFGVIAGFRGGFLDSLLMRLADIQLAFPSIIFAIMIAAVIGPSVINVIITLALTRWVVFARISRAAVLGVKEQEFVTAARAIGATAPRQLIRHIIPSIVAPLIVIATVEIGLVIIAEASLSFLGLGTPPSQPSWGQTIAQGRDYLNNAWWISTLPGIALCLVVICVGVFGDRLRDYLDPRMQKG